MKIIRVFPRRTSATPIDEMVFIGEPPMIRPEADEVHVSVAFTWDKPIAERLQKAWAQYYPIVKIGGPAYSSPCDTFTPGFYIREGFTFTSRGCNNLCASGHTHISAVFEMLSKQNRSAIFSGGLESKLIDNWFIEKLKA